MNRQKVAIILPVLNEREIIVHALRHFEALGAEEIIAVDGGSQDGTYQIIRDHFPSVKCLRADLAQRSFQMNSGALESESDVFVFVHADIRLPSGAVELIRGKIASGYAAGGFCKRYDRSNLLMDMYLAVSNYLYLRLMRGLVGTNAIFVKRQVFKRLGGFPKAPFLEDVMFSDALRKVGKPAVINEPVMVSARKYFENGIIRQIFRNARIILGYRLFHETPDKLKKIYRDDPKINTGYRIKLRSLYR